MNPNRNCLGTKPCFSIALNTDCSFFKRIKGALCKCSAVRLSASAHFPLLIEHVLSMICSSDFVPDAATVGVIEKIITVFDCKFCVQSVNFLLVVWLRVSLETSHNSICNCLIRGATVDYWSRIAGIFVVNSLPRLPN